MSNPVPVCTHIKADGVRCGSPAVSGTELCYHHSAVKTALGKAQPGGKAPHGGFAPIPFVFPEDRASMQINFFLLLQAYNEGRIDQRTYNSMLSLLKAMAKNLGKTGSLVEEKEEKQEERKPESRAERRAREREEEPGSNADRRPGEAQSRVDREWEEKTGERQQQDRIHPESSRSALPAAS